MLDSSSTPDLTTMSKSELKAVRRQVQEALSKSEARRKKDALKAVEQAVKEFGFSLKEILGWGSDTRSAKSLSRRRDTGAKFRNPENSEESWSGRGRRPRWFKAHLEAGRSEDDLRV
jgi:DNA-binding protein H-NS